MSQSSISSDSTDKRSVGSILNQALLDATLLDLQLTARKRPKGLLLGTYFPNFAGILFPPIWGSRLFPLAPKQEKLHFMVAAEGKLDHFDGTPDQSYIEDIQNFMKKIFISWDTRMDTTYGDCPALHTTGLQHYWKKKFPFAKHRFNDSCYSIKQRDPNQYYQRGAVRANNTPAPARTGPLVGSSVVSSTAARPKADPRRSQEALRIANVSKMVLKGKKHHK